MHFQPKTPTPTAMQSENFLETKQYLLSSHTVSTDQFKFPPTKKIVHDLDLQDNKKSHLQSVLRVQISFQAHDLKCQTTPFVVLLAKNDKIATSLQKQKNSVAYITSTLSEQYFYLLMERTQTPKCPKCLQLFKGTFEEHFQQDCLQKSSISRVSEKGAVFIDQTYMCGRCFASFGKKQWDYHQKKIRTACKGYNESGIHQFTPTKSFIDIGEIASDRDRFQTPQRREFSESRQRSVSKKQASSISQQDRLFSTSLFSDRQTQAQKITLTKEITEDETILLLLLNLLDAKSKIPLLDWVKNNRKIKSIYLQEFFEKFLVKTFNRLRAAIKVPTFDMLEEKAALKWKSILKQPEDIFNQEIILQSVKGLSASRKNKVLRCLNSIYKSSYEDVFPKFSIKITQPQQKRIELPLRPKDFFKILEQLFATKERDLVHIGIDLYLIFQSAQRLASDKQNITKGINQLIQDRKSNSTLCQLEMKIRKTSKSGKFILSEQLCQLLQQFQWKGFYQNGKIYQRMKKFFGFPVYSIKKCIFSEFQLQKTKYSQINLQSLAEHGNEKTSLGYAEAGVDINQKVIKDSLKIPNLRVCPISREALHRFLARRLRFRKHVKIYNNWLQRLKKKMQNYNKDLCDFYDSEKEVIVDEYGLIFFSQTQEQRVNKEGEKDQQKQQQQQQTNTETKKKAIIQQITQEEKVQINGIPFTFKNKKFNFDELFSHDSIEYCQGCDLEFFNAKQQGRICNICMEQYHDKCLPKFCRCIMPKPFPLNKGIPFKSQRYDNETKYKMPQQYLNNRNQQKLDHIIFLLAARRFRYTPTAILSEQVIIDQQMVNKSGAYRANLAYFDDYQAGGYFPPLFLDKSGDMTISGTGFGLFAAEDIPKDYFIGQYAGDIVNGSNSIYIKRYDSVMKIVEGARPANTLLIGPLKHCGYVCLINGTDGQNSNCRAAKVQINGYLRIIVVTTKKIKEGMQLCYNYDDTSKFKKQGLKLKSTKPLQQLKVPQGFHRCGLVNLGSSCYMQKCIYFRNACFQFLHILLGDHIKRQDSSQFQQELFEIMQELRKDKEVYDPSSNIGAILNEINAKKPQQSHFSIDKQADAHEFLLDLLDNRLNENAKTMVTGIAQSTIKCNKCLQESITRQPFTSLILQVSIQRTTICNKVSENVEYVCEICQHRRHQKTVQVFKRPNIMIISLKRFTSEFDKISDAVEEYDTPQGYELKAVIVHRGNSIASGHYVTEEYLDNFVCILDDSKVQFRLKSSTSVGYIFGYKKKEKRLE